jgi:hypothetical protein
MLGGIPLVNSSIPQSCSYSPDPPTRVPSPCYPFARLGGRVFNPPRRPADPLPPPAPSILGTPFVSGVLNAAARSSYY